MRWKPLGICHFHRAMSDVQDSDRVKMQRRSIGPAASSLEAWVHLVIEQRQRFNGDGEIGFYGQTSGGSHPVDRGPAEFNMSEDENGTTIHYKYNRVIVQ